MPVRLVVNLLKSNLAWLRFWCVLLIWAACGWNGMAQDRGLEGDVKMLSVMEKVEFRVSSESKWSLAKKGIRIPAGGWVRTGTWPS